MKPGRFWVDIESSGLSPQIDFILEIAVGVTDIHGNWIDMQSWMLPPTYRAKQAAVARAKRDSVVGPMHVNSGLWKDLETAPHLAEVDCEAAILNYLGKFEIDEPTPMCGSSVHFDRKFIERYMPQLDMWFHYRVIDNSSLKETCKDLNPPLYERSKIEVVPQKVHRGIPDLQDTVEEYRFYKENFLVTQSETKVQNDT